MKFQVMVQLRDYQDEGWQLGEMELSVNTVDTGRIVTVSTHTKMIIINEIINWWTAIFTNSQ